MSFSGKVLIPFRLKLLLAMLAAAGAGTYISYRVFSSGLEPFSEQEGGRALMSRLQTLAGVIEEEVRSGTQQARLTAGRTGLRELLERHANGSALPSDAADIARRLRDAVASSGALVSAEVAGTDGRIAASSEKARAGSGLLPGRQLRTALKGMQIGAPRAESGVIYYDVSVPVLPVGQTGSPVGVLRCRFKLADTGASALAAGKAGGSRLFLALAKRDSQRIIFYGGGKAAAETTLRSEDGTRFLAALSGRGGTFAASGESAAREVYGWLPVPAADWVLAGTAPAAAGAENTRSLLERARLGSALGFLLLAVSSFFAAGWLAAPLRDAGRQAGALLEQCGDPAADPDRLCEPKLLAAAVEKAALELKNQSSRDLELETETEKLREEELDLKSQNDELEKLNKYLMEREIKISELKKEITELREKVGSGAPY